MGESVWTEQDKKELFVGLATIKQQNVDQEKQLDTLFTKVDTLSRNGCAVGESHANRLRVLENGKHGTDDKDDKGVVRLSISAAGLTALGGGIGWLVVKLMEH